MILKFTNFFEQLPRIPDPHPTPNYRCHWSPMPDFKRPENSMHSWLKSDYNRDVPETDTELLQTPETELPK